MELVRTLTFTQCFRGIHLLIVIQHWVMNIRDRARNKDFPAIKVTFSIVASIFAQASSTGQNLTLSNLPKAVQYGRFYVYAEARASSPCQP